MIEALEHATEVARQNGPTGVMIAPDNLWAADVTSGACTGLAHRGLIRRARGALEAAQAAGVTVKWGWTKGHSKHPWNDIADALAEEGRREAGAEEQASASAEEQRGRRRPRRAPAARFQQRVDLSRVRAAAESGCQEAQRWLRQLQPTGDGMATVEAVYTRTNPFSRRNAEGINLQFPSRGLRQYIAGEVYVEIDIRASHPTMLQERLRRVGARIPLLDKWNADRAGCIAEVRADCARTGGATAKKLEEGDVKGVVLAALNGASVPKWARERWNMSQTPAALGRFGRDMKHARAQAHIWFPEIWEQVKDAKNDWARRSRTIFFAMTSLEDEVLEVMRKKLPDLGAECDALTGDGLLARPARTDAAPLPEALRALEAEVLAETGVQVTLTAKTLDGGAAVQWHRPAESPQKRWHSEWQQNQPWDACERPWELSGWQA